MFFTSITNKVAHYMAEIAEESEVSLFFFPLKIMCVYNFCTIFLVIL